MSIGITGASGPLGRAAAELVLQEVDPREVVLTTRHPDALADLAESGATVRRADFSDPGSLTAAFAGVTRLLLVSIDAIGARLDQHRAAVRAARSAGVEHVVYTSVPEPVAGNPALVVSDHAGTEQSLRDRGMRWTMLRNNLYAHLQFGTVENAAATGRLFTNHGAGAAAFVTRADCAVAAAGAMVQDGLAGLSLDVTGSTGVTAGHLADLASEVGRRDVEVVEVDDAAYASGLRAAGLPEPAAALVTSFGASIRAGYLDRTTDTVSRLTGRAPTPFADVVRGTLTSS